MNEKSLRHRNVQASRALALLGIPLFAGFASADVNLYVSAASGNDAWSGALATPNAARTDGPKATIPGAQNAIRSLKYAGNPAGITYVVNVAPGIYPVKNTLTFDDTDATTWTRYVSTVPHGAIIDGSIPVSGWKAPSATWAKRLNPKAKPFIVSADLEKLGVTRFGSLPSAHWVGTTYPSSYNELFVNDARQTVARWPNTGYARVKAGGDQFSFQADLSTSRIAANDPDVQIYSFASGLDWGFQSMPVAANPAAGTVKFQPTAGLSFPSTTGGRFYLRNSLEELDTPGEYYVDRTSGTLFWYPTAGYQKADVRVSVNNSVLVRFLNSRNVSLEGFTIRDCQDNAVDFQLGSGNSLVGCALKNVGGNGVTMRYTTNGLVQSCTFNEIGEGGVRMDGGGDLPTLTAGNNVVQNCRFKGLGRLVPSYRPAILLTGVGNKAIHNDISDLPHEAIQIEGNNLIVEGNTISNVCWDTSDAGAIYAFCPPIYRGNVIRGNIIANVRNKIDKGGIWGIYLDGRTSGVLVEKNVVRNTDIGMILNGGRDVQVRNNIMIDCPVAFQVDDLSGMPYGELASLASVPYQGATWATSYPNLVNILNDDPMYAKYNVFTDNVAINAQQTLNLRSAIMTLDPTLNPSSKTSLGWTNIISAPSATGLFVNADSGDYTPVANSTLAQIGFAPVDLSDAGVASDGQISAQGSNLR